MKHKFFLTVENGPDSTGSVYPEDTRFDVYVSGNHESHAANEHTGFWGQVRLPDAIPANQDHFDASPSGLAALRTLSAPAYWYATGLLDAAELMDDFERDPECESCRDILVTP